MQYVTAPNSTMFVRVNAKAIKKEFVLRVAVHNYEFANTTNALYVSDLVNITTHAQLQAYLSTLCKRYNYANYCIINNPYTALAKVTIQ